MEFRWHQFSLRDLLLLPVIVAVVACTVLFLMTGIRDTYRCPVCRTERIEQYWEGQVWSTETHETAFTHWRRRQGRDEHEHRWIRGGDVAIRNGFGVPFGMISRDMHGKMLMVYLSPEDQIAIYEHIGDFDQAESLFLKLTSRQAVTARQEWAAYKLLVDWKEAGYAPSWDEFVAANDPHSLSGLAAVRSGGGP